MALAAYLTYTGWSGAQAAFCEAGSSCDVVQSSSWGRFLGVPTAFWGLLTYAALAAIALRVPQPAVQWARATLVASVGWAISVYLTAVSIFVLDATCPYCLASLGVFTAILGLQAWARPLTGHRSWRRPVLQAAAVAVLVMLAMQARANSSLVASGDEDPYLRGLAVAVSDSGARFYGASWCPHCEEQKALFGASAARLPYVECSPGGRQGPTSRACLSAGVRTYPTWVFSDGERHVGTLTPDELAERVGYEGPAAETGE
jgi:uncharacterized membrane protein/thiol-disulfide isomerase/thioredoxin